MVVKGQHDDGCNPSDSSFFLLLQMYFQSQVFYFGKSETVHFI